MSPNSESASHFGQRAIRLEAAFAEDIAVWLRVHTSSGEWTKESEAVQSLASRLVRVVMTP